MTSCIKETKKKYIYRNSPSYSASKCKSMKKKGNDGKYYISKEGSNGVYKWVAIAEKNRKSKIKKLSLLDLQKLAKKYSVTKNGTKKELAKKLLQLRGHNLIKSDKENIENIIKNIKNKKSIKKRGNTLKRFFGI
jgi:hypothetical protein